MQRMAYLTVTVIVAFCFYAGVVCYPGGNETNKANSYLIEKWGQWHTYCDINKDGVLTWDDPQLFEEFYKGLGYLSDEQLKMLITRMNRLWKTFLFDYKTEVSGDDFIDMMTQRYESNKVAFIEMVRDYISEWCKAIDLDEDTFLSEHELVLNFVAQRHNNVTKNENFFYTFQPMNGQVAIEVVIGYFIRFATENDKSKMDIYKNAMDSGV